MDARFVLYLAQPSTGRLQEMLHSALAGTAYRLIRTPAQLAECRGARILFAVQLGEAGLSPGLYDLLFWLRAHPNALPDTLAGFAVDSPCDLYSKAVGRELALAANYAGCTLPGHSLVEAIGSLANFAQRARNASTTLSDAYRLSLQGLAANLAE